MFRFSHSKKKNNTDRELLESYQESRNLEILGELYNRYVHLVYGVCLKYLKDQEKSKDAVMQIFEKLIDEAFIKDIDNFQGWIYVVSRNHCLMELRKERKKVLTGINEEISDEFFMESSAEMHLLSEEWLDRMDGQLEKCLKQLPDAQKTCIELFYFKEKCYREIAEITRYELRMVKSHIQNGKRNLKNCLEKHS